MINNNIYEILGIKENATDKEIKIAYKKLAKKYHPDICKRPECEEKFKEINNIYDNWKNNKDSTRTNNYKNKTEIIRTTINYSLYKAVNGYTFKYKGKTVKIPPKIKNRQIIRIKVDNTIFIVTLKVYNYYYSINGRKFKLNFFDNNLVLKLPKGIKSGTKLRIKNKGLGKNGHFFIKINVRLSLKERITYFFKRISKILQ